MFISCLYAVFQIAISLALLKQKRGGFCFSPLFIKANETGFSL
jgi:hypothetical protein